MKSNGDEDPYIFPQRTTLYLACTNKLLKATPQVANFFEGNMHCAGVFDPKYLPDSDKNDNLHHVCDASCDDP